MSIIPFHGQWYSDVIIYDERKKYFYMWARKNRPLLDDEVRNMNLAIVDQIRRSMQKTFGEVGSPTEPYSKSSAIGANNAFKILSASIPNGGSGNRADNFLIRGGGNIENPAVLFAKGFYVFLTGDIEYNQQNDVGKGLTDDGFTETPIPDLTISPPGVDRVDIIYIDLHFSEASAVQGLNQSEYQDLNLKNPIVGTETANRARAVFDVRVWENWRFNHLDGSPRSLSEISNLRISEDIFNSNDFLGSIDTEMMSDPNPINKHYRIPIAILYRRGGQHNIQDADIVNLIDLYNKRILSLQELTYRVNHGGYTQADVDELNLMNTYAGLTGLMTPRFPFAVVDESAGATGTNRGLDTEAFNSNSVTPRVLDNGGKFQMKALYIGDQDQSDLPATGPNDLDDGELAVKDISAHSVYVGYDVETTGAREYTDRINVNMQGMTGFSGITVINETGETGTKCITVLTNDNTITVDYKGRLGLNTDMPGWTGPNEIWDTERFTGTLDAVNIVEDVNDSVRIREHLFVEKDAYIKRDSYGPSWKIPGVIDIDDPVLFGFTGMPKYGITGSPASVQVVPGVAVKGVTGSLRGYTGSFGFYEAYDADGERVYTIGSKGDNFDRQVLSLYGTSERDVFQSSVDFMHLPDNYVGTALTSGDIVTYTITLLSGLNITRTVGPLVNGGYSGLFEIASDINNPSGGGFHRTFTYQYAVTREFGDTGPITYITKTGEAFGAALNYEDPADGLFLRLLVKSMPEIDLGVDQVILNIRRSGYNPDLLVDFIKSGYYGSSLYGGDVIDLRFVKFDLGEAADAFMFNGDVYFNGGGLLNRVTFSPISIFRDDVYIYGKLTADRLMIQLAKFTNVQIDRDAQISEYLSVLGGVAVGYGPYVSAGLSQLSVLLNSEYGIRYNLKMLINGGIQANNINLRQSGSTDYVDFGVNWELIRSTLTSEAYVYVLMNGSATDPAFPFGIHIVDKRDTTDKYGLFVLEGDDGYGDPANPFNVLFWIKGGLKVGDPKDKNSIGSILAKRLTLDLTATEVDQQNILSLKNGTAFIDNLTVNSLQFSATNPSSSVIFTNPQNITVVKPRTGDKTFNKNDGITRRKEFSFDTFTDPPAVMFNVLSGTGSSDYTTLKEEQPAVWANDTLSFTNKLIEDMTLNAKRADNTITTADFNILTKYRNYEKWEYYRNNFSRIIVVNLGVLKITWAGYDNVAAGSGSGDEDISMDTLISAGGIKRYQFSSSLFKSDPSGNNTFDWINPTNNFVTTLRASFNNNNFVDSPVLYNLTKMLEIFIPISSWSVREIKYEEIGIGTYYERILYYPYASSMTNFNVLNFDQQYPTVPDKVWQAALYPRIIQQKMYSIDTQNQNVSSAYKIYEALWNVDVAIYPVTSGTCNNLVGDLLISYM